MDIETLGREFASIYDLCNQLLEPHLMGKQFLRQLWTLDPNLVGELDSQSGIRNWSFSKPEYSWSFARMSFWHSMTIARNIAILWYQAVHWADQENLHRALNFRWWRAAFASSSTSWKSRRNWSFGFRIAVSIWKLCFQAFATASWKKLLLPFRMGLLIAFTTMERALFPTLPMAEAFMPK